MNNRRCIWVFIIALAALISGNRTVAAADTPVVITASESGEDQFEELGEYGQPQWAERSRASATTKFYVLSPYELFVGALLESDIPRHGRSVHDLTQEIEIGFPHRLELDLENHLGLAKGKVSEDGTSIGVRYAFAGWDKLPLNPALLTTYEFGSDH